MAISSELFIISWWTHAKYLLDLTWYILVKIQAPTWHFKTYGDMSLYHGYSGVLNRMHERSLHALSGQLVAKSRLAHWYCHEPYESVIILLLYEHRVEASTVGFLSHISSIPQSRGKLPHAYVICMHWQERPSMCFDFAKYVEKIRNCIWRVFRVISK